MHRFIVATHVAGLSGTGGVARGRGFASLSRCCPVLLFHSFLSSLSFVAMWTLASACMVASGVSAAIALQFTRFRDLQPSLWGKASTFFQIMAAVGVMAARAYDNAAFLKISTALIWIVAVLAIVSGVDYSLRGVSYLRRRTEPL